jgi:hypothetical protein
MDGSINKLRIISLPNPDTSSAGGGGVDNISPGSIISSVASKIFEVQINPEQITRNFSIKYHEPNTPGANGSEFQFEKVNPEDLELKFILDGTGAVLQNDKPGADLLGNVLNQLPAEAQVAYVPLKVAQLQTAVYDFNDEQHRTPFILAQYGKLVFMGLLQNMAVNYNLFSPSGIPLRAEITLSLKSHSPFKDSASALSLLSSDLTRQHLVMAGENLVRICHKVYRDEKYYIEVARANGLVNFRNVEPGTSLTLPPIEKATVK